MNWIWNRKRPGGRSLPELPEELDPHRFFVQWIGKGACLIEQHRGVLRFEQTRICFQTEQGILSIEGDSLEMDCLTDVRAKVSGSVRSVTLEAKS
jgi:sporulation protein YqfC